MEAWLERFAATNFRRSSDTAHDLKTPLNVAVLNLELLRMRVARIRDDAEDEKISDYARAIETELRRMGQSFDALCVLSTPPRDEGEPQIVELGPLWVEVAAEAGMTVAMVAGAPVEGHLSRIRHCFRLFLDGASRLLERGQTGFEAEQTGSSFEVRACGPAMLPDFEPTKIFKFYYTDPTGNADLSLASARLIAETYGGELNASQDRDKVVLRLRFPTR